MKTLKEHNKEKLARHQRDRVAREQAHEYLGIICPECGSELCDPTPGLVLTSNPLQRNVYCRECKFKGYAVL